MLNTAQVALLTKELYFSLKADLVPPKFFFFLADRPWSRSELQQLNPWNNPITHSWPQHNLPQLVVLKWMPRLGVSPCVCGTRDRVWSCDSVPRENGNPMQDVVLENPPLYYSAVKKDKQNLRKKVVRHADVTDSEGSRVGWHFPHCVGL